MPKKIKLKFLMLFNGRSFISIFNQIWQYSKCENRKS